MKKKFILLIAGAVAVTGLAVTSPIGGDSSADAAVALDPATIGMRPNGGFLTASRLGQYERLIGRQFQWFVGMADRSSRPRHIPNATGTSVVERIVALRRQRWTGQHIAQEVGVSPATVSSILKRIGLSRLTALERPNPCAATSVKIPAN